MKKQKMFILWDESDGFRTSKIYFDIESARIALEENYTDYWIDNRKAKIEEIYAVSYIE